MTVVQMLLGIVFFNAAFCLVTIPASAIVHGMRREILGFGAALGTALPICMYLWG